MRAEWARNDSEKAVQQLILSRTKKAQAVGLPLVHGTRATMENYQAGIVGCAWCEARLPLARYFEPGLPCPPPPLRRASGLPRALADASHTLPIAGSWEASYARKAYFMGITRTLIRRNTRSVLIGYGSSPPRCGPSYSPLATRLRRPDTRPPSFRRDPFARERPYSRKINGLRAQTLA